MYTRAPISWQQAPGRGSCTTSWPAGGLACRGASAGSKHLAGGPCSTSWPAGGLVRVYTSTDQLASTWQLASARPAGLPGPRRCTTSWLACRGQGGGFFYTWLMYAVCVQKRVYMRFAHDVYSCTCTKHALHSRHHAQKHTTKTVVHHLPRNRPSTLENSGSKMLAYPERTNVLYAEACARSMRPQHAASNNLPSKTVFDGVYLAEESPPPSTPIFYYHSILRLLALTEATHSSKLLLRCDAHCFWRPSLPSLWHPMGAAAIITVVASAVGT